MVLKWTSTSKTFSQLFTTDTSAAKLIEFQRGNPPHELPITGMAFSPSGQYVVAGSADKSVTAWDVNQTAYHSTVTNVFQILLLVMLIGLCFGLPLLLLFRSFSRSLSYGSSGRGKNPVLEHSCQNAMRHHLQICHYSPINDLLLQTPEISIYKPRNYARKQINKRFRDGNSSRTRPHTRSHVYNRKGPP